MVQVDLGKSIALSKIVLHPCKDDFNGIGEGLGFRPASKWKSGDDPEFANGVTVLGDQTHEDFRNPRLMAVAFPVNGQAVRYVRVTATKLAPRKSDYNFALAELVAFDVTAQNVALGATVTALDSIEAPPRWRKTNLTDAYFPGANLAGEPEEIARLTEERDRMVASAMSDENRKSFAEVGRELADAEKGISELPPPHSVYAGTVHTGTGAFVGTGGRGGQPRVIQVLHRGDVNSPREVVEPGTVPIIDGLPSRFALPPEAPEGERRAALARWLTDSRNPLTWRSIVNRVWQYHFGRGLVDSPNDFGRMGQQPTHPELLDWLAVEFRDGGQSIKQLHRLIVTSATYRQASCASGDATAAEAIDADNRFLWRMNRRKLEAEAVRDSVLSVAGRLDLTMGGPSFRDFVIEQPAHIAALRISPARRGRSQVASSFGLSLDRSVTAPAVPDDARLRGPVDECGEAQREHERLAGAGAHEQPAHGGHGQTLRRTARAGSVRYRCPNRAWISGGSRSRAAA